LSPSQSFTGFSGLGFSAGAAGGASVKTGAFAAGAVVATGAGPALPNGSLLSCLNDTFSAKAKLAIKKVHRTMRKTGFLFAIQDYTVSAVFPEGQNFPIGNRSKGLWDSDQKRGFLREFRRSGVISS